ncbi:hypothetical protein BJV74DRAFT_954519 [Russula compacta]|nr:hypothetical protein BJV74DRAFT_954519 [Russula compacta]
MARIRVSLLSLPPELIEEIIIITTLLGDICAAAALAQTCRSFRTLVYHQLHKHLWREMFLVVFDDPRPARDVRTCGRATWPRLDPNNKEKAKCKNLHAVHDFPWEDEYKLRIWSESFILRRTRPPLSGSPSSSGVSPKVSSTDAELCTVLDTLLRVILTAAPLPYDTLASVASQCHTSCPPHPHPVFSPVFVVAHTQPALVLGSHNTTWLMRIFAHGLPCILTARLTAFDENGGVDVQKTPVKWEGLLLKLVAQIGLMIPIYGTPCSAEQPSETVLVTPFAAVSGDTDADNSGGMCSATNTATSAGEHGAESDSADKLATRDCRNVDQDAYYLPSDDNDSDFVPQPEGESSSESEEESGSDIDGDEVLAGTATSATTSQDGVRRLARIRVYNMAYLHPSRAFGPFLDMRHASSPPGTQKLGSREEKEAGTVGSPSIAAIPVPPIPDTNFFLSALADADGDLGNMDFSPFFDDDGWDTDNDETTEDVGGGSSSSPQEISGDKLHFDWAWIGAARQVIELNLRDLLMGRHQAVLRSLLSLEGLRSCSAPGFPSTAPEVVNEDDKGEGGLVFKDGEGWDWAGVEGQWRDLLGNNAQPLAERFSNPALYEVMRIIPLTLCITHYTRAPTAWPGRPTIHVAGDWHTSAMPPELARVRGTVEMAASGDVRWSMTSFREDGQGEWASEGVQLGGRGSNMGVIGMWTGAGHEPSDPLGPFWAWKVGPANGGASAVGERVHGTAAAVVASSSGSHGGGVGDGDGVRRATE